MKISRATHAVEAKKSSHAAWASASLLARAEHPLLLLAQASLVPIAANDVGSTARREWSTDWPCSERRVGSFGFVCSTSFVQHERYTSVFLRAPTAHPSNQYPWSSWQLVLFFRHEVSTNTTDTEIPTQSTTTTATITTTLASLASVTTISGEGGE